MTPVATAVQAVSQTGEPAQANTAVAVSMRMPDKPRASRMVVPLFMVCADSRMRHVNADLLGTLELIERGLLPVPSIRATIQGTFET